MWITNEGIVTKKDDLFYIKTRSDFEYEGRHINLNEPGFGAINVTIQEAPFGLPDSQISDWLSQFGKVSNFRKQFFWRNPLKGSSPNTVAAQGLLLRVSLYQDGCRKRIYFEGKVEEICTIIIPKGLEKYLKIPLT